MLVEINPRNIDSRLITQAVEVLKKGGLIILQLYKLPILS